MKHFKLILILIFYSLFVLSNAQSSEEELTNKISKNIRCLICQGQSVYDSQSDFAVSMRLVIRQKIQDGSSEDEIYEYLKAQYGDWISYNPEFNKYTFFLWSIPIFVFIVGGYLIFRKMKIFKL
tara:strand:+ start:1038 stop:1409 length:372 start_codon:yes stop_codon:yes gene_type:complete